MSDKEKSIYSYIASESFKNIAEGMLREALGALELPKLEKYISEALMSNIDNAYEENYFSIIDQAYSRYPELTVELMDFLSNRKGKEPQSASELGASIISEICTTITIYQAIIKILIYHTNILDEEEDE